MLVDQTFCRSLDSGVVGRSTTGRKGKLIFYSINLGKYESLPFLRWRESDVIDLPAAGRQIFSRLGPFQRFSISVWSWQAGNSVAAVSKSVLGDGAYVFWSMLSFHPCYYGFMGPLHKHWDVSVRSYLTFTVCLVELCMRLSFPGGHYHVIKDLYTLCKLPLVMYIHCC